MKKYHVHGFILYLIVLLIFYPASYGISQHTKTGRAAQGGAWELKAPLPVSLNSAGGGAANGKFYVMGGYDGSEQQYSVYEYDPVSDIWSQKSDIPYAFQHVWAGIMDDKFYIMGGNIAKTSTNLDSAYVYDPAFDTWTPLQKLPYPPRRGAATVCVDETIYLIGGIASGGNLTQVDFFVPEYNIWSYWGKAQLNEARHEAPGICFNNFIYVFGGLGNNTIHDSVERYSIEENTWTVCASLPTARYGHTVEIVDNKVYIMGGYDGTEILDDMDMFDPVSETIIPMPPMPDARFKAVSGVIDGKIYIATGNNETQPTNTLLVFTPDTTISRWIFDISPDSAFIQQDIVIEGYGFGDDQGASIVTFNGIPAATYFQWSDTRIYTEIPSGASTGPVYVITGSDSSNGFNYTIAAEEVITHTLSSAVPGDFSLKQNYPNPFNASTKINYSLPEQLHVQLTIFDVNGRAVRTLIDESMSAGTYQTMWDGTDDMGMHVASGQYLAKIMCGPEYADSIKLLLVKEDST
ncbi:kelch repeat-containing protein [candidate division KSB1 bacterium]